MAPSVSKYTQAREGLIDTILTFLQTTEANFNGRAINFYDRPLDVNDTFAGINALAIYHDPSVGIAFETETRRMVVQNTTSVATFVVHGFTVDDWSAAEAFEVDCRRAVLENAGIGCVATASLWQSLVFGMEIQHKNQSQERRCFFRATLGVTITEDTRA